jgi:hypothetical protein
MSITVDITSLMREKHDMLLFLVSDYANKLDAECDVIDADSRMAIQCV